MKRYCAYMDRIKVPDGLHEKLLAGGPSRRRSPALAAGILAACCCLAAVGVWQVWRSDGAVQRECAIGVAETPAALQQETPAVEHTLTVASDLFEGQPHGFFGIPSLEYPDCTGSPAMALDYALPEGWFTQPMTAQEIITALGGTEEVPRSLLWYDFGLDGMVIYDGAGRPWKVEIRGERGDETLELELWPGQAPLVDLIYEGAAVQQVDGMEVTSYALYYDRDGDEREEAVYHVYFQVGELGVSFEYCGRDREPGAELTSVLTAFAGAFTTAHLSAPPGQWEHLDLGTARIEGSGELTLGEAYGAELGIFLPAPETLPAGFAFDGAWWALDREQDWLRAAWSRGYEEVDLTIRRRQTLPEEETLPVYATDQINVQVLEELGRYVADDQGDVPGWRYDRFAVRYPQADGSTVDVEWSLKGVTPEKAAALVTAIPTAAPEQSGGVERIHPLKEAAHAGAD